MSLRLTDSSKLVTDKPIRVLLILKDVTYAQIGHSYNARENNLNSNYPDNGIY